MAIYTVFVFIAIVAQLCSGSGEDHASEVITFVKHHSNVITKEIEQRLNQGFKGSIAAHRDEKVVFELIPSVEPTFEPTFEPTKPPTVAPSTVKHAPTTVPTKVPTAEPTKKPTAEPTKVPTAEPTKVPTAEPTKVPTAAPTKVPTAPTTAFTFHVNMQVINDFSKPVYDSDTELHDLTLKQALASTMTDVQFSGITDLTVSDTSARAIRRALQASSVTLTYTVSGASRYSASQLADQLQDALVSGTFDSALHLFATQNGATGLLNANSNSVETDINEGSSDETLSTGAIIGIAIGCAAFLVIVGVLIWYFCSAKVLPQETRGLI